MINDEYTREDELDENQNDAGQEENTDNSHEDNQDQDQSHQDDTDWKAEALKYKAILERNKNKPEKTSAKKSDEMDYGQKAYLTANGIKGAKEFDFVKDEMKKSGMDLDSLLENDYFQSKLTKFRAVTKSEEAVPKGTRTNGVATDSVEYWMSKPIAEVPQDMRIKVVNAKMAKEQTKGVFYNS